LFFILILLIAQTGVSAFCNETTRLTINARGKLNYQKIVVPTMRYKNIFSINSRLELVGQVRNSSCLEVFGIDAKVLRSTCLGSRNITSVRIGESGDVAGVYYEKTDSGEEIPRIFRLDSQGTLELLSIPKSLETDVHYAEVTGINDSGTIVGFVSNYQYAFLDFLDTVVVSFLAKPNDPLTIISPTASLGTQANGIVDNLVFGIIRRATEDQLGLEVVGWMYDLVSASNIWFGEVDSVGSQMSKSGDYLNSATFFSTGHQPLNLKFRGYSGFYARKKNALLSEGSAISADGYRVWTKNEGAVSFNFSNFTSYHIEKDGQMSENLSCAIPASSGVAPLFIELAQKGIALFLVGGKPVVFVPAERDSLSNYCLFTRFEVPPSARKDLRVIRKLHLKERHQLKNGQKVPMTIKVYNSKGRPLKGVRVSLDLDNDGKPAIKHWTTDAQGTAKLRIPFYDRSRNSYSFMGQIKIKKPGYYRLTSTIYPHRYRARWV